MKKSVMRILICLTLALALVFTASACNKDDKKKVKTTSVPKDKAIKPIQEPDIKDYGKTKEIKEPVKEESADFLKVDLTGEEVTQKIGKPETTEPPVKNEKNGLFYSKWKYEKQGIELSMVGEAGKEKVNSLYISSPSKFQTTRKIGIGSTLEDVERAYSGNINKSASHPDFIVIGSVTNGIMFQLDDGKVNKITIAAYLDK